MKRFLFPLIAMTLISSNAFARHAYRSENCKFEDLSLEYKGNYPVGGMYAMSRKGQEYDVSALPMYDVSESPNTTADADVIFTESETKILSETPPVSECGFEHTEWVSEKIISIDQLTEGAAKQLGLKAGDKFKFVCEESTDYPDDSECDHD